MSNWLNYSLSERRAMLQTVAEKEGIPDYAVEKDWWVTVVLKALLNLSCSDHILFKGGTSLSKGWRLIERFSEDIDIALSHKFFQLPTDNNTQLKKLRKTCRAYVIETICNELSQALIELGHEDLEVVAETAIDGVPISTDADPTVINVFYKSITDGHSEYIPTKVKVEISCLSMDIPFENKHITTLISDAFPQVDINTDSYIPTVLPSRTFLEKAFLLCEEFQKEAPRSLRMSRHLYDLECLMDTSFADEALRSLELYSNLVEHRRKFYHVGYADYDKDYPNLISILPPERVLSEWKADYEEFVKRFVYGKALPFEQLTARIEELQKRFRAINQIFNDYDKDHTSNR